MMDNTYKNRFVKNSAWIIGGRVFQMAISFFVSMITARYLGPSNYGVINYAASFSAFFTPLCSLGLNSILVNELITRKNDIGKILGTTIVMRLVSSLLSVIGIVSAVFFLDMGETETLLVTAIYSIGLLFQCVESLNYYYQANMLSKYPTIASMVAYVIVTIYRVVLLISRKDVAFFAFSYTLDHIVVAGLLFLLYFQQKGLRLRFSVSDAKILWSKGHHFILSGLMVAIYAQTDKIMLKAMISEREVGLYAAANTICTTWVFVLSALIESARPAILSRKEENKLLFEQDLKKLYGSILYLSLFVSALFSLFAKPVVLLLYGKSYIEAVPLVRILTWSTAFSYLGVARSIWMVAENKQKYEKFIAAGGAIANVILNVSLIGSMGAIGATIATLITQIITNLLIGFMIPVIRQNSVLVLKSFDTIKYIGGLIKSVLTTDREKNDKGRTKEL